MNAKHTPAPWHVCTGNHETFGNVLNIAAQEGDVPAICVISNVEDATEEDRANARLIAAAPDLLEALKAMLDAEPGYGWGGSSEAEIAAQELARAAIAKATGEQ